METIDITEEPTVPAVSGSPFFKIPGGKRKLADAILSHLPENFFNMPTSQFVEPFLGAGAVSLRVAAKFVEKGLSQEEIASRLFLNDGNPHIANLWNAVSQDSEGLLDEFNELTKQHNEDNYYSTRNLIEPSFIGKKNFEDPLTTAANFLYLNKNCFNGLIRYNKNGEFNSPVGSYPKEQTVDAENIRKIARMGLQVSCSDFVEHVENLMKGGDLNENTVVYFDPPYVPLNITSSFTDYTAGGFNEDDQLRLRGLVDRLTRIGVKVILSNSNTPWVKREYKEYNIYTIRAKRSINSVGSRRGKIKELIVTNFNP